MLPQLWCGTTLNVADQRLHTQAQSERDTFREFHINCTLLEEERPCQYYFANEVCQCLTDYRQVEEFKIAYEYGYKLKVPLATRTKKG